MATERHGLRKLTDELSYLPGFVAAGGIPAEAGESRVGQALVPEPQRDAREPGPGDRLARGTLEYLCIGGPRAGIVGRVGSRYRQHEEESGAGPVTGGLLACRRSLRPVIQREGPEREEVPS